MDEAQRIAVAVKTAVSPQIEARIDYTTAMHFLERVKMSVQALVYHGYVKTPEIHLVPVKIGLLPKPYEVIVRLDADLFGDLAVQVTSRDLEAHVEKNR